MKQVRIFWLAILTVAVTSSVPALGQCIDTAARTQAQQVPAARVVDLKSSDGTLLKANYFAAAKPGPGVVLIHQVNRTRQSWDDVARQLAADGINTLTIDMRGHGSGETPYDKLTDAELGKIWRGNPDDVETALRYLESQPGMLRQQPNGFRFAIRPRSHA